jgi:hypothetical protein
MPTPAARLLAVLVAGAALAAGCGRPSRSLRQPLAGSVVIDGLPAFAGVISFSPRAGHAGPVASGPIQDGRYAFTAANGPTAGPYRAVIFFVRDAAEARSFQPVHDKARPPRPLETPVPPDKQPTADVDAEQGPQEALEGTAPEPLGAERKGVKSDAPTTPAERPQEPVPEPRPPANMREFDVTVPATVPPRLDFSISGGDFP